VRPIIVVVLAAAALAACGPQQDFRPACDPKPGTQCGPVFVPSPAPTSAPPPVWPPPQR
jgi:hypothetical protein